MAIYRTPQFLKLREEGKTNREIAEVFGVSYRTVEDWVACAVSEGLTEYKRGGRRTPDALLSRIKELWAQGLHIDDVAAALGSTRGSVQGILTRFRIRRDKTVHKARVFDAPYVEQVTALAREGKTDAKIGEAMGLTATAVLRIRKRNGIAPGVRKGCSVMWSQEQTDTLVSLWNARQSPSQIANIMCLTRNQVEGKAQRLKLPRHGEALPRRVYSTAHLHSPEARKKAAERKAMRPTVVAKVVAPEFIPETARPWLTQMQGECKYPYGPRGNVHFCCQPTWRKSIYCEGHHGLCYVENTKKRAA